MGGRILGGRETPLLAREGPAFLKERRSCSPSPQAPHPFPSALFQRGHRPCGQGPYGPKKAEKARFFRFLRAGRRRCASATFFERMIRCDSLPRQHKIKISRNLPEAPRFPHAFFLLPKKSRPRLRERGGDFFSGKNFLLFRTVLGKALLHDTDSTTAHFTVIIHFHYSSCVIL